VNYLLRKRQGNRRHISIRHRDNRQWHLSVVYVRNWQMHGRAEEALAGQLVTPS